MLRYKPTTPINITINTLSNDDIRICVFDSPETPIPCSPHKKVRRRFIGGDTKIIMKKLFGFCTYSIVGHFDTGPLQVFLFEDKTIPASDDIIAKSPTGFFHIIDIPQRMPTS